MLLGKRFGLRTQCRESTHAWMLDCRPHLLSLHRQMMQACHRCTLLHFAQFKIQHRQDTSSTRGAAPPGRGGPPRPRRARRSGQRSRCERWGGCAGRRGRTSNAAARGTSFSRSFVLTRLAPKPTPFIKSRRSSSITTNYSATAINRKRLRRRADRVNGTVSVEQERPQLSGHRFKYRLRYINDILKY